MFVCFINSGEKNRNMWKEKINFDEVSEKFYDKFSYKLIQIVFADNPSFLL